ncbi:MAG: hypothetical protein HW416_1646 [Chloroflexi bacterium]|nr:hypothetical protein [Chloroflexota bacterium]
MRGVWPTLTSILLAMVILGCAGAPGTSSGRSVGSDATDVSTRSAPKRINAAVAGNPVALHKAVQSNLASQTPGVDALEELLDAGMTHLDNQGNLLAQLAETVPSLDNGLWELFADGRMRTTWRIREGARWHDGAPFTAEDLVFTWRVGRDRETPYFGHPGYASIESVEATDARTVDVAWSRPFIRADAMFSSHAEWAVPLPRHILEAPFLQDKEGFGRLPYWTQEYVGSGPFRLRVWEPGSHLLLEAFDGYALGRPVIDEILVKVIQDQNALVANILAGEVELTLGKTLSVEQALRVRERWQEGRVESGLANWIVVYPQFLNPSPEALLNVEFRRALVHAVDRQNIVDTLMAGITSVADTFVNPQEAEYRDIEPGIIRYGYDVRRAQELIAGAGYQVGEGGVFRSRTGEPLQIEFRTDGGNDLFEKTLFAVADYWRQAGVGVDTLLVSPQRKDDREYQATFPGFMVTRNPTDLGSLGGYSSANAYVPANNFRSAGGVNRSRYMNPEFDGLINVFNATIPPSDRMRIGREIVQHMTDRVTAIGVFYDVEPTMIGSRLTNVSARMKRSTQGWNAIDWGLR